MRALPIHVRTLASAGPNANGKKVPAVDPMVGTRSTWSYYLAPWSSSQALLDWTAKQLQQGVSRIQRRPLFGTQCRPVGGPAGFEPHRHRTAPCTYTCLRLLGNVRVRATSEGASSISRGDVLAHCRGFGTCGWTDVGGTSTRTKIVGPTALAARPTLYVSGARPQRPVGCPSTLVREVELLRPKPTRIPVAGLALAIPTERKARGLDPVARDKPSDNLMLKRCASRLPFTPRGPGPGGKGRPDPSRVRAQAV